MILKHETDEPTGDRLETLTTMRTILSEASEFACPNFMELIAFLVDRRPDNSGEEAS